MDSHAAVPGLNREDVYSLKKAIPPLKEQKIIAKILSDLDEKIEISKNMNEILEELGQTLFKRWFVDFEFPDEKGKPYRSSSGEMIESELGEIPKGWEIGCLGDILYNQQGFAFKGKDLLDFGDYPVIKIRNISKGVVDIENTQFINENVAKKTDEKFLISSGSILIAMTGAKVAKVGLVENTNLKLWLNQRVGMFKNRKKGGVNYAYSMLSIETNRDFLRGTAYGSAQANISSSDIENVEIITPPENILNYFNRLIERSIYKKAENLSTINSLKKIRDLLLPKLMSGKIRVPVQIKA